MKEHQTGQDFDKKESWKREGCLKGFVSIPKRIIQEVEFVSSHRKREQQAKALASSLYRDYKEGKRSLDDVYDVILEIRNEDIPKSWYVYWNFTYIPLLKPETD